MLQRLTKKQISKLGKKSSYKTKQTGGLLKFHRPNFLKGVLKKNKNTLVMNDEYKKFILDVSKMLIARAVINKRSADQSIIFTPLDVKIILIYLLHKKEFSNIAKLLKTKFKKINKIIENPYITEISQPKNNIQKYSKLYTDIFQLIFGNDNNIDFIYNNKESYISWLNNYYDFLYDNDISMFLEFFKYETSEDGLTFIKKKDEDFCNIANTSNAAKWVGIVQGIEPILKNTEECKNYSKKTKKKGSIFINSTLTSATPQILEKANPTGPKPVPAPKPTPPYIYIDPRASAQL